MENIKLTNELTDSIVLKVQAHIKGKMPGSTCGVEYTTACEHIEKNARILIEELLKSRCDFDNCWDAIAFRCLYIRRFENKYNLELDCYYTNFIGPIRLSTILYTPRHSICIFTSKLRDVLGQSYLENIAKQVELYDSTYHKVLNSYKEVLYSYRFVHTLLSDYPEFVNFMPDYISEQIYVSPKIQASKVIRLFESGELHKIAV